MRLIIFILASLLLVGGLIASAGDNSGPMNKDDERPPPREVADGEDNETGKDTYKRDLPKASSERKEERKQMVEEQIAKPPFGFTAVKDEKVLETMRVVPRHVFVPGRLHKMAYEDTPLPIGHGQTISQPYMVGLMTELLELTPKSKVLEIGTGSGYQAAILAHLTPHVYTVEIIETLANRAKETLQQQGYDEVHCLRADGYHGWADEAPFDAIIVTCAAGHLPPPLWEQLNPGGRIVIPIGGPYEVQRLVIVTKQEDGSRKSRSISGVRFVPLTREDDRES